MVSHAFQKAFVESENIDSINMEKYISSSINADQEKKFVDICMGRTVELSLNDVFELICIADEFEAEEISQKLLPMIQKEKSSFILNQFIQLLNSKYYLSPTLVGLIASDFYNLFNTNAADLQNAPPQLLQAILESPKCAYPPARKLNRFLIEASTKNQELLRFVQQKSLTSSEYNKFVSLASEMIKQHKIKLEEPPVDEIELDSIDLLVQSQISRLRLEQFIAQVQPPPNAKKSETVFDRWNQINAQISKFNGIMSEITKMKESNASYDQLIESLKEFNNNSNNLEKQLIELKNEVAKAKAAVEKSTRDLANCKQAIEQEKAKNELLKAQKQENEQKQEENVEENKDNNEVQADGNPNPEENNQNENPQ